MSKLDRKKMINKHLLKHIFFTNMNHNFKYGFIFAFWMEKDKDYEPPEFRTTIPISTIDKLRDVFQGKTVFLVGSGPSLDKNITLLSDYCRSRNRSEFVVVACDGSIWDLKEHGLRPDYVISCEADGQHNRPIIPTTCQLLKDGKVEWWDDVPLIANTWLSKSYKENYPNDDIYWYINQDPRYFEFWNNHRNIFPQKNLDGSNIDWPVLEPRTSCVGFHGIEVCRRLEAKEIILLGFDMSVPNKKEHHSKHFNLTWEETNMDLTQCYNDHIMWFLAHYDADFDYNVVNCTEGGAMVNDLTDAKVMPLSQKLEEMESTNVTVANR